MKQTPAVGVELLRVLVVEDETLIRWAVVQTLSAAGHTVLEATDAATARRVLSGAGEPIDVVLLDFRLPDSGDLALLEHIRWQSPSSAVVVMTAFGTPQMTAQAKALGVYDVIAKPFDVGALAERLAQAHRSKRR